MKKRKWLLLAMTIIMTTCLFEGCGETESIDTEDHDLTNGSANTAPVEPTNTSAVAEDDENKVEFSFADLSNLEFWFASGGGAWCTVLTVNEDGTFEGEYHDSEMGEIGKDYPNGVYYLCDFTGKFTEPEKVDDYTYSVRIESIELDEKAQTEEIKDGMKYIYSEPYGLDEAEEILIYMPGIALKELPEGYRNWVGYSNLEEAKDTQLPFYGLYNVRPEYGFSSCDKEETSSIDDELASVEQKAAVLEQKLKTKDITQLEMTEVSSELYQLWDDELNALWTQLNEKIDSTTMDTLRIKEREWITYKEGEMKKAGTQYESGSIESMAENNKGAELTKERVYELAEYLR